MVITPSYTNKEAAPAEPVDIQFIKSVTDIITPEEAAYVADIKSVCDTCEECSCTEDECRDIVFVTKIMGFADKFRILHWSAENHAAHVVIDDFCKSLETYKDSLAENIQAINGQFKANDELFQHIEIPCGENPLDIINELKIAINNWMGATAEDIMYEGARNATSTFLEQLYKTVYLLRLSK